MGNFNDAVRAMTETCGTCGHKGFMANPHDCYWVFRERMYGRFDLTKEGESEVRSGRPLAVNQKAIP
jgi:hypothetical protein